ncbi:MAG: phosphate ABC transporter substrate-binding protein [Clostridia bacterium]
MKKKLAVITIGVLLVASIFAGCASSPATTGEVAGETTTLSGEINVAGSTSVQPLSEELASAFMEKYPDVVVNIAGGGSSAGVKAAQEGTADIGASSRELKAEETGITATVIAKDGIAVIFNPANGIKDLTMDQLKNIFIGKITNWKEVGGNDATISVVSREDGSGTRGAFDELVLGKDATVVASATIQNSAGSVKSAVMSDANAIGYISLGAVDDTVNVPSIDGVVASKETVLDGTYKISRPFLYLTKAPSEVTTAFIDFVLSPDGQAIVGQDYIALP